MKPKFLSSILLFLTLVLLTFSQIPAHILSIKQGEEELNLHAIVDENSPLYMEKEDPFNELMGLEGCENGDKECFNRRVLTEAHLDYIYTQRHKAP